MFTNLTTANFLTYHYMDYHMPDNVKLNTVCLSAEVEPVVRSWQRIVVTFSITALIIAYRMYPYFTRDDPKDMSLGTSFFF